jgi:peptidoglycan/LPS O-acetylase OafA/YrhL
MGGMLGTKMIAAEPKMATTPNRIRAVWQVQPWVHSLDPLRGIAALAVVVNHAAHAWKLADDPSATATLLDWLGSWGVTLFFVLSGFCIHLPQARAFGRNPTHRMNWSRFAQRRAWRLLPTHYAALILSAIVGIYVQTALVNAPTVKSFTTHVLMVHVFSHDLYNSINAVFWSIAVEIYFYICYPLYLFLRRQFGPFRTVAVLLVGGLGIYSVSSALLHGGVRFVGQHLFLVSWWQWALGAAVAEVYIAGYDTIWSRLFLPRFAPVVWIVLSLCVGLKDPTVLGLHARFWILPALCACVLGSLVVRQTKPVPGLSYSGVFSYSIYLIHPVAFAVLFSISGYSALPAAIAVPMTIVFSVLMSWVFFLLIERHFLSAKQHNAEKVVLN